MIAACNVAQIGWLLSARSFASEWKRTPKVLTTFSFAIRPVMVAEANFQSPKPRGLKIWAITPPTAAKILESMSSVIPNEPPAKLKFDNNQMKMDAKRIMVPAFLIKLVERSSMER